MVLSGYHIYSGPLVRDEGGGCVDLQEQMMNFVSWFIGRLPVFLSAEPICYFVGFFFAFVTIALLDRLLHLGR